MSMGFLSPATSRWSGAGPCCTASSSSFCAASTGANSTTWLSTSRPGTGDVQLSLIQTAPLTGAVVVTTPSDVSLEDARKAIIMFHQVKVPILGMVENMSYLTCPHCNERIDVFSTAAAGTADEMEVHFLGELPLDPVGADWRRYRRPIVTAKR